MLRLKGGQRANYLSPSKQPPRGTCQLRYRVSHVLLRKPSLPSVSIRSSISFVPIVHALPDRKHINDDHLLNKTKSICKRERERERERELPVTTRLNLAPHTILATSLSWKNGTTSGLFKEFLWLVILLKNDKNEKKTYPSMIGVAKAQLSLYISAP